MFRNLAVTVALIACFLAAPAGAAQKNSIMLDSGGAFWLVSATMTQGAPASILVVRCTPNVCGEKFSSWFEKDRIFAHGTLTYGGSTLSLEDVRFFELHKTGGSIEAVLHVTRVTQAGGQSGVDSQLF